MGDNSLAVINFRGPRITCMDGTPSCVPSSPARSTISPKARPRLHRAHDIAIDLDRDDSSADQAVGQTWNNRLDATH
jgi:hypothetical protein